MNAGDHFSRQAVDYAQYRPQYPAVLFENLARLCPSTGLAWDCGCGNGQASTGLLPWFSSIIATDISKQQIRHAHLHDRIDYRVASAERSGIDPQSVDLVLVAQALHWFNSAAFYREAERVLKPGGLLAALCYQLPRITAAIDDIVDTFHDATLADYWPPQRHHVNEAYRNIPFPLQRVSFPALAMEQQWTLEQFLGYLRSWSAVARFAQKNLHDPVESMRIRIAAHWIDGRATMRIRWPLTVLAGRFAADG